MTDFRSTRRDFLAASSAAALAVGRASVPAVAADKPAAKAAGKATSCIFLWLGGGAAHIDTFDPKRLGDPKTKKAGGAYPAIDTAIPGVKVCEHLAETAKMLDRGVLLRSLNHDLNDEHAAPTNLFKTGRKTNSTVVYPSIGSVISHEIGEHDRPVPQYVVMGYPNVTRGPGFLGSKYSYVYLLDTADGPPALRRPDDIGADRAKRREQLLEGLRKDFAAKAAGDKSVADYAAASEQGLRLAGPEFMGAFDLKSEKGGLRTAYGDEFGQRCLLARRLVQRGVKFVEVASNLNFVNGTGWDTHNEGQLKQHLLIQGLDRALAALIRDLEAHKLLDKTLVVVATEFGRPPEFDGKGGRGHQCRAFTCALFGGGLKTGQAIGETDELGKAIVKRPISVADFHATIYAALGIDPHTLLFDGDRPVPATDGGKVVTEAFSA